MNIQEYIDKQCGRGKTEFDIGIRTIRKGKRGEFIVDDSCHTRLIGKIRLDTEFLYRINKMFKKVFA